LRALCGSSRGYNYDVGSNKKFSYKVVGVKYFLLRPIPFPFLAAVYKLFLKILFNTEIEFYKGYMPLFAIKEFSNISVYRKLAQKEG